MIIIADFFSDFDAMGYMLFSIKTFGQEIHSASTSFYYDILHDFLSEWVVTFLYVHCAALSLMNHDATSATADMKIQLILDFV